MRTRLLVLLMVGLTAIAMPVTAQDEEEYRMEIGGALGTDFYLGDVNSTPFANPSVAGAFLWRRNFNPRMGLKANLALAHLKGSSGSRFIPADAATAGAEGGDPVSVSFKRSVVDLGVQYEMNLLGYGMGHEYQDMHRVSPYFAFGIGCTVAMGGGEDAAVGFNIPVGVGVKYKWKRRVNVGVEWSFRFTTTDEIDAGGQATLADPYNVKSSGFKNKDAYSMFMVFITYDISPKCRECRNNN